MLVSKGSEQNPRHQTMINEKVLSVAKVVRKRFRKIYIWL